MSRNDYISGWLELSEPLGEEKVDSLVKRIMFSGSVSFERHAEEEMRKDDLGKIDIFDVLENGSCLRSDLRDGSWRYRIQKNDVVVVVAFPSDNRVKVVTAWKRKG